MTDATDTSWLDDSATPVRIESASKIRGEAKRGNGMQKRAGRKVKAWDCDGQYVFFRRKLANPATLKRLMTQTAKGELKYITTSDDVEMYEVQATSPFHRKENTNFGTLDMATLTRTIVVGACKHEWADFVDGLEELAGRLKNARYTDGKPAREDFMRELYQDRVTHIFNMIRQRRGPDPAIIDREVAALRTRRGDHRSRTSILLPG